ncbi:hypothetical protein [Thermogutta sp.]|uniref:hypothetical protein n=1 Tax=Thermogutta sp. TaxID=1962930 RepID=UPI003C7B71EB
MNQQDQAEEGPAVLVGFPIPVNQARRVCGQHVAAEWALRRLGLWPVVFFVAMGVLALAAGLRAAVAQQSTSSVLSGWMTEPPMEIPQQVPPPATSQTGQSGAPSSANAPQSTSATETGQPGAAAGTSPPVSQPSPPAVEEVKPEQIYLRDSDGSLKLMLGWTMAQFEELVRLRDALEQRSRPPAYALEGVNITGKAFDHYAELFIECKVRILTDTPVRVPLGLEQIILREIPRRADGSQLLIFRNQNDGGYVVFLQGKKDSLEDITLQAWVPVVQNGNDRRLVLTVPETPVSELELELPVENPGLTVGPGTTLVGTETTAAKTTRVKVAGLGPGFELAWHGEATPEKEKPPILESAGLVLIRTSGTNLEFDARLTLRTYTTPFDRVRIRLPQGAALLPTNTSGYTVTEVSGNSEERGFGRVVEVSFPKKVTGPVEVRLNARRPVDSHDWMNLAGFSVENAVRQWGYLAVVVTADQTIIWGNLVGVRQIARLPNTQEAIEATGSFEYYCQPYTLAIKVVPRLSTLSVSPQYRVDFSSTELLLQGTLSCEVRGGEVSTIDLDSSGWQISEVTLRGEDLPLVLSQSEGSVTTIALPRRMSGKFEISFKARQDAPPRGEVFRLAFPRVKASRIQPAELILVAAPNIDLRPHPQESEGVMTAAVSESNLAVPNVFAWRLTSPGATLVAEWDSRPREITVEMETRVQVQGNQAEIEQRLRFQVAYQPWAEPWRLTIPRDLDGKVVALLDGRPVEIKKAVGSPSANSSLGALQDDGASEYLVTPLTPVLGVVELVLRYSYPFPTAEAESLSWRLPLIEPRDGHLLRHRLTVTLPSGWRVERINSPWEARSDIVPVGIKSATLEFETNAPVGEAAILLRASEIAGTRSVVVERLLIQSRMDRNMRQDRCVMEFRTARSNLLIRLPRTVRGDVAQIWLDGRAVQSRVSGRSEVIIPLTGTEGEAGSGQDTVHHLEIWYELPRFRSDWGRTRLELPQIEDPVLLRWMYWEIVLLPDEHIVWTSSPLTMEYRWSWLGYFWGRIPSLTEEQLEQWAGVSEGWLHVPVQANRYLFSSLRTVSAADVWTFRRSWIVAVCSGAVVLLGWGWIYLSRSWKRLVTLGVIGFLIGLGFLRPDVALLMAEASALGIGLAILSWFLYRAVTPPQPSRVAMSGWGERTSMDTVVCQRSLDDNACTVPSGESATHSHA